MRASLDQTLRRAGLRATRQRLAVLETLAERQDAVTAQDLYLQFRGEGESIGLSTVYRTLTSLSDAGLLDTFTRDGEQAFRYCSRDHHHHLVCTECNRVIELEASLVEDWVDKVSATYDFEVSGHRADIFGRCEDCHG